MSYIDEGEPAPLLLPFFLRLVGAVVAWRIGLYARSKQADERCFFLFLLYYYEKLPLLLGRGHSKPPARSSTQSWPPTVARRRPRG